MDSRYKNRKVISQDLGNEEILFSLKGIFDNFLFFTLLFLYQKKVIIYYDKNYNFRSIYQNMDTKHKSSPLNIQFNMVMQESRTTLKNNKLKLIEEDLIMLIDHPHISQILKMNKREVIINKESPLQLIVSTKFGFMNSTIQ